MSAPCKAGIERLQTIASLMEKQSRVASWGIRTVTGPLLAAAGVVVYLVFGTPEPAHRRVGRDGAALYGHRTARRVVLYYGLKAVQLTEMSNRVWKTDRGVQPHSV